MSFELSSQTGAGIQGRQRAWEEVGIGIREGNGEVGLGILSTILSVWVFLGQVFATEIKTWTDTGTVDAESVTKNFGTHLL